MQLEKYLPEEAFVASWKVEGYSYKIVYITIINQTSGKSIGNQGGVKWGNQFLT